MFNLSSMTSPGLAGFMGGMSSLGWTPSNVPTGAFGDAFNLNTAFNSVLGPSQLLGTGGAPTGLTAAISGSIGGDAALSMNAAIPTFGVVTERTPVYNYQRYAFDNREQSGRCAPVFVGDTNGDGSVSTADLVQNSDTSCGHHEYRNGYEALRNSYGDQNGMIKGDALSHVQIWLDDNKDGQIQDAEFRHPCDYGIVGIDTQNGEIIRKNLLGYRCTPHQAVTGYYNFNTYSSNTGADNQSFTYTPVTAGASTQYGFTGLSDFSNIGQVPNYTGNSNSWGAYGTQGGGQGQGYGYGWNGSGWGNGYG